MRSHQFPDRLGKRWSRGACPKNRSLAPNALAADQGLWRGVPESRRGPPRCQSWRRGSRTLARPVHGSARTSWGPADRTDGCTTASLHCETGQLYRGTFRPHTADEESAISEPPPNSLEKYLVVRVRVDYAAVPDCNVSSSVTAQQPRKDSLEGTTFFLPIHQPPCPT